MTITKQVLLNWLTY